MSLWRHMWWTRVYYNSGRRKIITHHDIVNKQLKEENKKLNVNENKNENEIENEN